MSQTTVQVADYSEVVLDPKGEALYRHSAATMVDRMLRLLPPREGDPDDVVPVFGDVKTLRDAVVELNTRLLAHFDRIAHDSDRDSRGDHKPCLSCATTATNEDGEPFTGSSEVCDHSGEDLRVLTIHTERLVLEINSTHDSSLTGHGANLDNAPMASAEGAISADGDIVRDGADVPGSDSPVEQSAATGAAASARPHHSPTKNAGAA